MIRREISPAPPGPAQALRNVGTSHGQQTAVAQNLTTLLRLSTTVPKGLITGCENTS
jgi:hypothetical protein